MERFDLYMVTGKPGTGKSTVGAKLGKSLDVSILDPDLMRRQMGFKKHDPADTPRVMGEIFDRMEGRLQRREPVVLCTPYVMRSRREQSYEQLTEISAEIGEQLEAVLIQCSCDEEIAKARIQARPEPDDFHSLSNDPTVFERYHRQFEPLSSDEIDQNPHVSFLGYDSGKNTIKRIAVRPRHEARIQIVERHITRI